MDSLQSVTCSLSTLFVTSFWIWKTRPLKQRVFELIEKKVVHNTTAASSNGKATVKIETKNLEAASASRKHGHRIDNEDGVHKDYKMNEKEAVNFLLADWLNTEKAMTQRQPASHL